MDITVYNLQKGRLETIEFEFTESNTTWFSPGNDPKAISMITDFNGDILIRQFDYTYPIRIHGKSRADVGYNRRKARRLLRL
ncbi:MAG: hypothetical protein H6Q57_2356 [Geobacteraceae bacterium]|jgi:hypothetical protein|nr:hypothetical protein [Geobacteraceae bacterium]